MDLQTTIYRYANYQERSHQEVRNKLYELGAYKAQVEELITELIEKDILNEERYAQAIARGKFRMLQWGRVKIVHQLKQQRVSQYNIRQALKEIDEDEYLQTLDKLATRKWEELRSVKNKEQRKSKVYQYLLGKGYESGIIVPALQTLINSST